MQRKRRRKLLLFVLLLALIGNSFTVQAEGKQKSNMKDMDIAEYRNKDIKTLKKKVKLKKDKKKNIYTDKYKTAFIKTNKKGKITEIKVRGSSTKALKYAPDFGGIELGMEAFSIDMYMEEEDNVVKLYPDMYTKGTDDDTKEGDFVIYGQEENTYDSLTIKSKLFKRSESDKKVYEITWKSKGVNEKNLKKYKYHDVDAEKKAAEEQARLEAEQKEAKKQEELSKEYIFPDSDKKYLSEDEVRSMPVDKLYIGRNEIFARHGYIFGDENLKNHFEATSWYQGTIAGADFQSSSVFNDFETKNVELIKRIEDEINGVAKMEAEQQQVIEDAKNFLVGHTFHLMDSQPLMTFESSDTISYVWGGEVETEYYNYSISARYEVYRDDRKEWLLFLTIDGEEYYFRYFPDNGQMDLTSMSGNGPIQGWYELYR